MLFRLSTTISAAVALLAFTTNATKMDTHSFDGPFNDIDEHGRRTISTENWKTTFATEVKNNFVRLTPDRQSKKGAIWSKKSIDSSEFSTVIAFRISGQGKRWFGDGIGIWITQTPRHIYGRNHGFIEKYTGVGIILDTFVNTDHDGGHKDVSVMINDGTKTLDDFQNNKDYPKQGCDAAFRYYEGHGGFNPVYSSSRLKVQLKDNYLTIEVDTKATGEWVPCFKGPIDLPRGWLKDATLGISASTGSLADNHDILRITSYNEESDPEVSLSDSDAMLHNLSKNYDEWVNSDGCGAECKLSILQKKFKDFGVEFEHKMESLIEKTQNTIKKMKEKEQSNMDKIEGLEKTVKEMVDKSMNKRMGGMSRLMTKRIERQVNKDVELTSGSWKTPFVMLLFVLSAGSAVLFKKYQQLRKSHLL